MILEGNIAVGFTDRLAPFLDRHSTSVLDVGCGEGTMGMELCRKVNKLIAVDTSAEAIETIGARVREHNLENIAIVHGDIFSVASDNKFDIITFFLSLHHITHIDSVLRKCRDLSHAETKIAVAEIAPGRTAFHRYDAVPYDTLSLDFLVKKFRENGFRLLLQAPLPSLFRIDKQDIPNRFTVYMALFGQ